MTNFSIIVPVYNVEKYLSQCLDSILNQTYDDYEVIMVDDGSTDSSGLICDAYTQRDTRFKVIHQENSGVCIARKVGILQASKEYVVWVDGDDFIGQNHLQDLNTIIEQYAPDIVAFGYTLTKENGMAYATCMNAVQGDKLYSTAENSFYSKMIYDPMDSKKDNFGSFYHMLWGKTTKREIMQRCMLAVPDEVRIGEDMAAVFTAFQRCSTVYVSPICSYFYRQCNTSIVHTFRSDELQRSRVLFAFLYQNIRKIPRENIDAYVLTVVLNKLVHSIDSFKQYNAFAHYARTEITPDLNTIIQRTPIPPMPFKRKLIFSMLKKRCYAGLWFNFHTRKSILQHIRKLHFKNVKNLQAEE